MEHHQSHLPPAPGSSMMVPPPAMPELLGYCFVWLP